MSKLIEGVPRSTWYYRKKHPPRERGGVKFSEAARLLGITPQSVRRTARKIGVKTAEEVIEYYREKQAQQISWEIITE